MASSKKWEPSYTHRERLMDLASTNSSRMGSFWARDLSSSEYRTLFEAGLFQHLTYLKLEHIYWPGTLAPSRADVGHVHWFAPNLDTASLSPTLPIALDEGHLGLHLRFPALRYLIIATSMRNTSKTASAEEVPRSTSTVPTNLDQLRWIPSLIRGASNLELLEMNILSLIEIPWASLFEEDPISIPTLVRVHLGGTAQTRMYDLLELIGANRIPPYVKLSVHAYRHQIPETLRGYSLTLERALRTRSLDSICINVWSCSPETYGNNVLRILAFSSAELSSAGLTVIDLLDGKIRGHINREFSVFSFMPCVMPAGGDPEVMLGNSLELLAKAFAQVKISTLVIDQEISGNWATIMHRFIRTSLMGVANLHFVRTSATDLPVLETLVVSMDVASTRKCKHVLQSTGDIRMWWDELVKALKYRSDVGLRLRKLQIVGGWASEKLRKRTEKLDAEMLAQVFALVGKVDDKRTVDLEGDELSIDARRSWWGLKLA